MQEPSCNPRAAGPGSRHPGRRLAGWQAGPPRCAALSRSWPVSQPGHLHIVPVLTGTPSHRPGRDRQDRAGAGYQDRQEAGQTGHFSRRARVDAARRTLRLFRHAYIGVLARDLLRAPRRGTGVKPGAVHPAAAVIADIHPRKITGSDPRQSGSWARAGQDGPQRNFRIDRSGGRGHAGARRAGSGGVPGGRVRHTRG